MTVDNIMLGSTQIVTSQQVIAQESNPSDGFTIPAHLRGFEGVQQRKQDYRSDVASGYLEFTQQRLNFSSLCKFAIVQLHLIDKE